MSYNTQGLPDDFMANNPDFFANFPADDQQMMDYDSGNDYNQTINPSDLSDFADMDVGSGFQQPQEMVPVQTDMQYQQPPQPDKSMGPCYNPAVGWYYPAAQPANVPPMPMPYQMNQTPVSSVPQSGFNSGMSTPAPALANPAPMAAPASVPSPEESSSSTPEPAPKPKRTRAPGKRKYGPSAYLDARAEGRNSVTNGDANFFASTASRRDGRRDPNAETITSLFSRTNTRPTIVQACVCSDKAADRPKRPKNAFILYRAANSETWKRKLGTNNNNHVSKVASEAWNSEPKEVRDQWFKMAVEEKKRHAEKYPDYKYVPGGGARAKFGSVSCSCGAFEANMANFQKSKPDPTGASPPSNNYSYDDLDVSDDDDVFVPTTRRSRTQKPAPTAVMQAPSSLPANVESLGLPANQVAEARKMLENKKRKYNNLTVATDGELPLAKRRATRASRKASVNYADEDDDAIEQDFDFSAACATPASSKVQQYSPPAKNTRSQSRASLTEDAEGMELDELEWYQSLPDPFPEQEEDVGDNIVVASKPAARKSFAELNVSGRRRSPRHAK